MSEKKNIKVKEASVLLTLKTKYPDFWRKWYGVAHDYYIAAKTSAKLNSEDLPKQK